MIKFGIGLIIGVVVGAVAMLFFSALGSRNNPVITASYPASSTIHISVDQSYLNKQLTAALAGMPQFKGVQPTLAMQAPNSVIVNIDMQATVSGITLKARPAVLMQLTVEAGRIRTRVANVNIGILNVPLAPFQAQIDQIERVMEDQANRAVANGLAGTGLKIISVSTTNNSLNVDLGE